MTKSILINFNFLASLNIRNFIDKNFSLTQIKFINDYFDLLANILVSNYEMLSFNDANRYNIVVVYFSMWIMY